MPTAEENRIAFWKNCVTQLKKENAVVLLEYGDIHRIALGTIAEVLPAGFTFVEAGITEGRAKYIDYGHVDSLERMPVQLTGETAPKTRAAGR